MIAPTHSNFVVTSSARLLLPKPQNYDESLQYFTLIAKSPNLDFDHGHSSVVFDLANG